MCIIFSATMHKAVEVIAAGSTAYYDLLGRAVRADTLIGIGIFYMGKSLAHLVNIEKTAQSITNSMTTGKVNEVGPNYYILLLHR